MKSEIFRSRLRSLGISAECIETTVGDLELMAAYKYDNYEMYNTATRFFEHMLIWLRQFREEHRETVLKFLGNKLVFISQKEMQDLARFLYYDRIVPEILKIIIHHEKLKPFSYATAFTSHFKNYLRHCLFVGLSDGSKIDFFRRHHIDLSQEQVLPYYRTPAKDYLHKLRTETGNPDDNFHTVFLIDDFSGSGSTLIREERSDTGKVSYEGVLNRVFDIHSEIMDQAENIYLCHYVATEESIRHVTEMTNKIQAFRGKIKMLTSLVLRDEIRITPQNSSADPLMSSMAEICDIYYNKNYEDVNTSKKGGIKYGYGDVGLPLVLYSNTPNNSIYLLWYNADSDKVKFSGLFNRINRHRPNN